MEDTPSNESSLMLTSITSIASSFNNEHKSTVSKDNTYHTNTNITINEQSNNMIAIFEEEKEIKEVIVEYDEKLLEAEEVLMTMCKKALKVAVDFNGIFSYMEKAMK